MLTGLRCPELIKAGTFVDKYIGEVITPKEVEQRTINQYSQGLSYLFNLDKFQDDHPEDHKFYAVDGADFGNCTRFINHSCDPNLLIHAVTRNRSSFDIYDLAMFACRDIPAYEELTFQYVRHEEDDGSPPGDTFRWPCYCGAKNCCGWLW